MVARQVQIPNGVNLDVLRNGLPGSSNRQDDGPLNNQMKQVPQPEWVKKVWDTYKPEAVVQRVQQQASGVKQGVEDWSQSVRESPRRSDTKQAVPEMPEQKYSGQSEFVPGLGMYDPTKGDDQFASQWAREQEIATLEVDTKAKKDKSKGDKPEILVNDKNSNVIIKEISDAEFGKLAPLEQASVRYNTLLNDALRSDDARSETAQLVRGLELKTGNITLDDMMRNEGFISEQNFDMLRPGSFGQPQGFSPEVTDNADRSAIAMRLNSLTKDVSDGRVALGGREVDLTGYGDIRSRLDEYLRRLGDDAGADATLGRSSKEADFEAAFEYMAQRNPGQSFTYDDVIASLTASQYDPEEFLQYVGQRIQNTKSALANNTKASLGTTVGVDYYTPDEMLSAWGLAVG